MVCLVLYYNFVPNLDKQELESLKEASYDAKILADALVTQGYPSNWTETNVQRIGLMGKNGINDSKVLRYKNISYEDTKELLNLRSEYAVIFSRLDDGTYNISGVSIIGHPSATVSNSRLIPNEEYFDMVALTRLVVHNKTAIKMVVYAWR